MSRGYSSSVSLRYMPQLDSLRTLAVGAVLVSHYKSQWMAWFHWGWAGVQLFFLISGFLITGILLGVRREHPDTRAEAGRHLKAFYLRRSLRIFPAYYLVLLVYLILFREDRALAGWHLLYASNIWMAVTGKLLDHTLHFWSLCVEEQFYLVWPLLVLFVPFRRLPLLLLLGVASATLYRSVAAAFQWSGGAAGYLPMPNLDALGMGALLAVLSAKSQGRALRDRCLKGALALGLPLFLILLAVPHQEGPGNLALRILSPLALSLIFFWVVGRASIGFSGVLKSMLEWRPAVYLGKISYGIYLYHGLVLEGIYWMYDHHPFPRFLKPILFFGSTVLVAALSWHLFERPINELRKGIEYDKIPKKETEVEVQPDSPRKPERTLTRRY